MKYDLILCDPPYYYNSRNNRETKFGGGCSRYYPLMKDNELLEMEIPSNDNAIMFMWATCPRLDFAIELMKKWGFSYKTVAFTWVKTNKDGDYKINPGYYTASNAEIVLLGIKGKNNGRFKPVKTMTQQIIAEPIREHSRKPDAVIERIEMMYPHLSKIEIFSRCKREGWDQFGNEKEKFNEQM